MELKTITIKNKKLYDLLKEKKEIVKEGQGINKKLEPLSKKVKPLQEKLQELQNKLAAKESKMRPLQEEDYKKFRGDLADYEELIMFQMGKNEDDIDYKIVDLIEKTKENWKAGKEKENEYFNTK